MCNGWLLVLIPIRLHYNCMALKATLEAYEFITYEVFMFHSFQSNHCTFQGRAFVKQLRTNLNHSSIKRHLTQGMNQYI